MTRPLSSAERSVKKRQGWLMEEERKARESRGEQGQMEFWLRLTRSRIAKDIKAGRGDVWAGFTLVCRLFMTAMDKRAAGDRRLWDDLLRYAQQVVDHNPPA
ncbi:hypothetical protein [Streptomyces sp. NBC_00474]|uniref:hypothetical protein n=1 Tax=Streptomyces sp. NBC_00474 TaxID=2975754 RepID=UPI002259B352|nr:hypothetical protein [Streptomyces sp. NBC_00474]MCX5055089.1 hypothetical protein [Streptomyces sp. NBC_00474]